MTSPYWRERVWLLPSPQRQAREADCLGSARNIKDEKERHHISKVGGEEIALSGCGSSGLNQGEYETDSGGGPPDPLSDGVLRNVHSKFPLTRMIKDIIMREKS